MRWNAWVGLCAALGLGSCMALWLPTPWLDWQPTLAAAQPWRAVTAALVHWSPLHLAANLLGAATVAALGTAARLPAAAAGAWAAAWPLTQLGLLLQPELAHYGGASGVLHAGVAITALWLGAQATGRRRWIGVAIGVGLVIKVVLEVPFGPPLRTVAGWDIAIAPAAHASGVVAGVLCATVMLTQCRGGRRR